MKGLRLSGCDVHPMRSVSFSAPADGDGLSAPAVARPAASATAAATTTTARTDDRRRLERALKLIRGSFRGLDAWRDRRTRAWPRRRPRPGPGSTIPPRVQSSKGAPNELQRTLQ